MADAADEPLTAAVELALANVRSDRPMTGLAAAGWILMATGFTAIAAVFIAGMLAALVFLLTSSPVGAGVGAILGLGISVMIPARPNRDWRKRLTREGMPVKVVRRGTDVTLSVPGPVRFIYRLAPGEAALETLSLRSAPALPGSLRGVARDLRVGPLVFDEGLQLTGEPAHLACVTAPMRAALAAVGLPVRFEQGMLHIAVKRGRFALPAGSLDALAAALDQLARDLADPPTALRRVCGEGGFDAARAWPLTDQPTPSRGSDPFSVCVDACLAGDAGAALRSGLTRQACFATLRGLYRGGAAQAGSAALVFSANALPDTEAGCLDAIGLLAAMESLAARARLERLGQIGSLAAARWLSETQLPSAHGLQAAADAARAAIHARLHVQGALTLPVDDVQGGVTIVEAGQLSAVED